MNAKTRCRLNFRENSTFTKSIVAGPKIVMVNQISHTQVRKESIALNPSS